MNLHSELAGLLNLSLGNEFRTFLNFKTVMSRILFSTASFGVGLLKLIFRLMGLVKSVDTVFYKVDMLGDWLMAEPAIRLLIDKYKDENCLLVVSEETRAYRLWRPLAVTTIELPVEPVGIGWRWQISRLRRGYLIVKFCVRYRCGKLISLRHNKDVVKRFVFSHLDADVVIENTESIEEYARILKNIPKEIIRHWLVLNRIGMGIREPSMILPNLGRAKSQGNYVVFGLYGSRPIRDWPMEYWAELIAKIFFEIVDIQIWVSPSQVCRATQFVKSLTECDRKRVTVCTGSISKLHNAVMNAKCIVSVETFTAHLAVAVDAPAVLLIGGGHYGEFAPWISSARQIWVSNYLPCFNCNWSCSRQGAECITHITPGIVADAISRINLKL